MKTTILTLIAIFSLATVAAASPTGPRQTVRIKRLSHELEEVTNRMHRRAEFGFRSGYGRGYYRRGARDGALEALRGLDRHARRFHRKVEWHGRSLHRTEGEFFALLRAYRRADRALEFVAVGPRIRRDLRETGMLIDELSAAYGRASYRNGAHGRRYQPGHDRGDNGRGRPRGTRGGGDWVQK